jgi:protein tyrosine/serine phosphatase
MAKFIVLFALLLLILPVNAKTVSKKLISVPQKPKFTMINITIKNFGKVDNCYYRAGQIKGAEFNQLKALGIKTVVNLRYPFPFTKGKMLKQKEIANSMGMDYINIPILVFTNPSKEKIDKYFEILNNPKNYPVFVHDRDGENREGLMVAMYRIKCSKWTYEQAYDEMKRYGYRWYLYPSLKEYLKDFAEANK